jgi:hypothetical protein
MAMRTYFQMYEVTANRRGDRADRIEIADVDGAGLSMLDLVELAATSQKFVHDDKGKRLFRVLSVTPDSGYKGAKALDVVVNCGPYGEGGDVTDIQGNISHAMTGEEGILRPVLVRFVEHRSQNRVLCVSSRMGTHGAMSQMSAAIQSVAEAKLVNTTVGVNGLNPAQALTAWLDKGTVSELEFVTNRDPKSLDEQLNSPKGREAKVTASVKIKLTGGLFNKRKIQKLIRNAAARKQFVIDTNMSWDDDPDGYLRVPVRLGGRERVVRLPLNSDTVIGRVSYDPTEAPQLDDRSNPKVEWLRAEADRLIVDLIR